MSQTLANINWNTWQDIDITMLQNAVLTQWPELNQPLADMREHYKLYQGSIYSRVAELHYNGGFYD